MNRAALVIAVVAGLTGFVLLQTHKRRFEARASGGAPVGVVVAKTDLPLGTTITEDSIGFRALPASYVEERHIRALDADKIIGVPVSLAVRANESLLWSDLSSASAERRDLSGLVQDGMRAVTVRVSANGTLAGLLRPGDRIDLLFSRPDRDLPVTSILLQNVLVLAVGSDVGAHRHDRKINAGPDVTLSATVMQAQVLVHASHAGTLSAVLRNPGDVVVARDLPQTTSADLMTQALRRIQRKSVGETPSEIEHVR